MEGLERFIEETVVDGEILEMEGETSSVSQAARELGVSEESIIKSLVFFVDERPVLVVVPGPSRVDEEKLASAFEADEARMASPEEVLEETGYEIGGVPPVDVPLPKAVDERVLDHEEVYGGGGSERRILRIDPRFIVDEDSVVDDLTEY